MWDKVWAPHICCLTCTANHNSWSNGYKHQMPFAIPMIWREQLDHVTDFYFCLTNTRGFSQKNKARIVYPNLYSAIILLRNINPPRLCNGTRVSVKKMMNNIIEATILNGKFKEDVLLPRIQIISTDMPFEFKRLQFPVWLVFAMTINKAHRQSLQMCGLNLGNPCFS